MAACKGAGMSRQALRSATIVVMLHTFKQRVQHTGR